MADQILTLPLSALRVFTVAARFENFKRAAAELGVTPTAVSAQIKTLEAHLGRPLFQRNAQSVALNAAGERLAEECEEIFRQLERAVADASNTGARSSITVGVGALIGAQWLSRRLFSFWQRFPETGLYLHYSAGGVQFSDGQSDVMLVWGDGDWPQLTSEPLLRFPTAPVLSPTLLADTHTPLMPADLLDLPLLHWKDQFDWQEWFAAQGVDTGGRLAGVVIDDSSVLLRAALSGQGVALGLLPLIQEELQSGSLIRPFDRNFSPSRSYHLVYPPTALDTPQLRDFRDWILTEAAQPLHPS